MNDENKKDSMNRKKKKKKKKKKKHVPASKPINNQLKSLLIYIF